MIYLDHTATTPLDPRVAAAMEPFGAQVFGNPSSIHRVGREARAALEQARASVASSIGARSGEILFTSGGTEADNLAITGLARAARRRGRDGIITAAAEHHAVLEPCRQLSREGFRVTILPVNAQGRVEPDSVAAALDDRTALVSVMHGNNEVGTLSAVRAIADVTHERGALLHTDAVQTAGKIPVDVADLDADLMTLSAHKFYGPKGIGALFVRRTVDVDPLVFGGGQERGTRPGTESAALAAGLARALELAREEMPVESARLAGLRDALQNELTRTFEGVQINGHLSERLPHILNISFDSRVVTMEGEMLVVNMDLEGIAVTSGSACTSGSMQPSHVLLAMGRDEATAKATLRFAFGKSNTEQDIPDVVAALGRSLERMRRR